MPRLASIACLALICLLIAACGGDENTTTSAQTSAQESTESTGTTATQSTSEATGPPTAQKSSVPSPTGDHGPKYFETPSHNVGCYLSHKSVRCDIRERAWSPPPKPKFCIKFGVDWGQGIGVGSDKAEFVCAGDTVLGGPGLLDYGRTAERGPIICASGRKGITCQNTDTDHGFFMSRQSYRIY